MIREAVRKGKNAVQARKKLTDVYGEGVLTVRQCQNWFAKFRSGNFDVEDASRSGRPVEADKDAIKALVDANRRITTREIGMRLNLSNSTVYDHLKGLGLSSKLDLLPDNTMINLEVYCHQLDKLNDALQQKRSFSCRPRTASERILLFLLLAVCILCAILVVLLCQQKSPPLLRVFDCIKDTESCQNASCSHVCLTETCVQAAATLLKNMDPVVSPCEDFYQFACGKWAQHHELPSDRSYYDTFSLMKDELKAKLRELLEEPLCEEDSNATISAKNLYVSCMNERAIEELKEQPLLNLLEELGGWPVISSNWSEEYFDWVLQIARLRQYNNDILLGQWVAPDGKNSSLNIIQLDQADLGLPSKEYYIQGTQQLEAYGRFMVDIAQLLGATPEQAENDMREVLEFETVLANFTIPSEERRNYTAIYLKMTLAELQEKILLVNWTLYFSIAMPLELTDDEEVVVYAVPYLLSMSDLVTNTSKRYAVSKNY
ncbi:membrane metallo-endopeptidase-like 1 [Trichonephila clavipes]|nr:membrane metallo-endopeptidase-like 1 [Trichonephila clavipes]